MVTRAVKIGELRDNLSAYIRRVRQGDVVVVRDRDVPVACLVPYVPDAEVADAEMELSALAAEGRVRLPKQPADWRAVYRLRVPKLKSNALLEALLADRDEG